VSKPVHVPICKPKARVKVCGQTKMVGKGDSFFVNGDKITLSGTTNLDAIKNEIQSQSKSVNVSITVDPATKEKCLMIVNKLSDPMILRNGCAGGIYKEVLDYSIKQDNQVCFSKETVAGPTTLTNTPSGGGNATIVGSSVASYTTNTITADQNKQGLVKNNICITAGTGYSPGDVVRVMGGTPVVSQGTSGIMDLTVSNPGYGYTNANGIATPLTIKIGQRGEPGSGATVDYNSISYDSTKN